jgi:hypothetical protein
VYHNHIIIPSCVLVLLYGIVADPDPGSGAFFNPGSGMEKNPDPESGNIPDHFYESLETVLELKILKFFDADPDLGS